VLRTGVISVSESGAAGECACAKLLSRHGGRVGAGGARGGQNWCHSVRDPQVRLEELRQNLQDFSNTSFVQIYWL
jgi:hypothetical protein